MKTTRRHYVGYLTTKHHHLVVLLCRRLQVGVAAAAAWEQLRLGLRRHGGEMGGPWAVHQLPQISDAILMMVLHFHVRRLTKKKKVERNEN